MNSPRFQSYATDIMLESLGACLTLLALLLYLRARDVGTPRTMAFFACGLTALFFLKYNYLASGGACSRSLGGQTAALADRS
jgi:hypothetical protein